MPRVPDGPPADARRATQYQRLLTDGVIEGYRAEYSSSDGVDLEVVALRFEDQKRAKAMTLAPVKSPAYGSAHRVVFGSTVVQITTRSHFSTCLETVQRYISSLR